VSYLSHQYLLSPLLIPLPPTSTLFPYTTLFRSVFFAIIACRCSLAESRRLQGLLQQVFGLFNRHVDASGDEALAHEPFFVDNGVSANEDCVSIFDVFGGEVTLHADRTVSFNIVAINNILGRRPHVH